MTKSHRTTLRLEPELLERLRELAAAEGVSVSAYVRRVAEGSLSWEGSDLRQFGIFIPPDELARIDEASKRSGMRRGQWLRAVLWNAVRANDHEEKDHEG